MVWCETLGTFLISTVFLEWEGERHKVRLEILINYKRVSFSPSQTPNILELKEVRYLIFHDPQLVKLNH